MKLETNADRFDELQPWFVGEIIEGIKRQLTNAGIQGDRLKELCGDIAFSVCTEIDGSAGFVVDGTDYSPYLAFSDSEESMFWPGGNSYLHEYVFGVLDEIFEDNA